MTDYSMHQDENADFLNNPENFHAAFSHLELVLKPYKLGYYEHDLFTGSIQCSEICKANYGLESDVILKRSELFNAILPQYHDYVEAQLKNAIADHQQYTAEYEIAWPDGSVHWIKATGFAIYNEQGKPVKIIGITVDVTEARRAEEKQSILSAIIDTSDDTILSKTLEGVITSWNKSAERMFGYSAQEVIGKHISLLIPPERLHEEATILANIGAGKRVDHFVTERVRKDGSIVPISLSVSPIKNSHGKIIGASKIARDISLQKLAQEKDSMLAAIVDTSDDTIISKTLDGKITSWNKAAEKMFGYTAGEALGNSISLIIPASRSAEEGEIIKRVSTGERINHFETIRVAKDGKYVPISLSVSPIHDSYGTVIGCSKIARNLTEKKDSDEKKAVLAAIVDSSEDAIVSKTLGGIITSWNRGAERIFGYLEDEMLGKHISMIIPADRLNEEDHIISNISKGKRVAHFETYRLVKGKGEVAVSLSVSPVMDADGNIIGASKIARDISEQLRDKELLKRQNESLEILNSIGKTIAQKLDVSEILQHVTDATTKLTGADFGAFLYNTVGPQGEAFMLYTLSGATQEAFEKLGCPGIPRFFTQLSAGREFRGSTTLPRTRVMAKTVRMQVYQQGTCLL